ncbi:MAG: translation initiation factor IF-2, partial [Alistipes sp.]|nr:translation initiation factor IF-2 [Alistipes sp.]
MTNNRKIRLIQVAKEFKVGLNTITDFLLKKGISSDLSPNALVSDDVYATLEKEFGGNKGITGRERDNIREKISMGKKESVTIEASKREQTEEAEEVIVKSNIISVKDEVPQPKILGKIDLNAPAKPKVEPQPKKEEVKPEPQKVEPVKAAPVEEAPKAEPVKEEP